MIQRYTISWLSYEDSFKIKMGIIMICSILVGLLIVFIVNIEFNTLMGLELQ